MPALCVFAFFSLADRFSPVKLFFISLVLGALTYSADAWLAKDAASLFALRFLTGFFIAGIYPVGMKIAADWYEKGLGKALSFLLRALVLGTAFLHLLKNRDFFASVGVPKSSASHHLTSGAPPPCLQQAA